MKKNNYLKTGDVIFLKNGMTVYTAIPEKFVYDNKPMSNEKTRCDIVIGKLFTTNQNIKYNINSLAKDIIDDFDFRLGIKLTIKEAIEIIAPKILAFTKESFILPEGEFVVTTTKYDGGGTGMGPHDRYPDGHHVFCKRLKDGQYDERGAEVDFYQSGNNTATIEPKEISPIRKMTMKFV